jgi:uncharacterized protein (DUF433 family)
MIGGGVYSLSEAARLTGLRRARIKNWFEGRSGEPIPRPVFSSDYEPVGGDYAISFLDLVEVFVAGQLREHGVSLQYIRKAHVKLQTDWDTKHPFSKKDVRTDGKKIFAVLDDNERKIVYDVVTRNQVFESFILPVLEKIDYDQATRDALKWHLTDMVVLDPKVCFGKPVVEDVGITTYVLAASYYANGQDAKAVARWYEIDEAHVIAAVEYEASNAA